MMGMNLFAPQSISEHVSYVNALVNVLACNKSALVRELYVRAMLQWQLPAYVQLATIRTRAFKFELWLDDHPNVDVADFVRWDDAGYDWTVPFMVKRPRSRTKLRSSTPRDEMNLLVYRVREMDHVTDDNLQQRQLRLPSPRHLPSTEDPPSPVMALLGPPLLTAPRRDPTPESPSKLRTMVQAQGDERLTKIHANFEEFRRTGKQPARESIEEGPPTKRYRPSEMSDYRPYSMSPTPPRAQAGTAPILNDQLGSHLPTAKRLGSTELFPDRYQARKDTPATDETQTKDQDSFGEGTGISTRDFAYTEDNTAAPHVDAEQGTVSAQLSPEPPSIPSSRRAAARSDSSLSSVESTESSRARKAHAVKLSQDKSRVELNSGKSTASVGFASNASSLFQNSVNAILPSSSKTSAEDVTRELSKNPTWRDTRNRRERGSESSLDGASEGEGLARRSSKRFRENTVAASPSKRRQKQHQTDGNTAPIASLPGLGILPEPSEPCETSTTSSSKEGAIEGDGELRSNQVPTSVYIADRKS
jgi:hypothetical protein